MRKALLTEQGKGEMASHIEALETSERDLRRQVAEWKLKCEATERCETERREAETKRHKEEVAYLESYARQLKGQLEAAISPSAKKPLPAAAPATTG
jgi:dynein light intermediate chain